MRFYYGFLVFCLLLPGRSVEAQDLREWASKDGRTLHGEYVSHSETGVTIRVGESKKEVTLKIDQLSVADANYVKLQTFIQQEAAQLDSLNIVSYQLDQPIQPNATNLKEAGMKFKLAPFASLWYGVSFCVNDNDSERGVQQFREAVKRIEEQRKIDPTRHSLTFASALNNLGVAHLKQQKPEEACRYFLRAYDLVADRAVATMHNLVQFQQISSKQNSSFKVDDKSNTKLVAVVAEIVKKSNRQQFQPGWYYSSDIDVPSASLKHLAIDGLLPPAQSLELASFGTGFVIGKNTILAHANVVAADRMESDVVTCSVFDGKVWTRHHIDSVSLAGPKSSFVPAPLANPQLAAISMKKPVQPATVWKWEQVVGGPPLAILDSSTDFAFGVPLAVSPVRLQQPTAVFGFIQGPKSLTEGVQVSKGDVIAMDAKAERFETQSRLVHSMRGGPCVDAQFHILGFVNAAVAGKDKKAVCECITSSDVLQWLTEMNRANIPQSANGGNANGVSRDRVKQATVAIATWRQRSDLDKNLYVLFNHPANQPSRVNRDPWCFTCEGDGLVKCPGCRGAGRIEDGFETVVLGVDPTTGNQIIQQKQAYKPCPRCRGDRRQRCPDCQNGKI